MAEVINTLAGLVQLNDLNNADINVSDLLQDAPLVASLEAVAASNGTNHKYLKETVAEGVAFRDVNSGVTNANSQDEQITAALKILDAGFSVDKAIADGYKDGAEAYLEKRVMRKLAAAIASAEGQLIYGTGNDSDGFTGLIENSALDALADGMVYGGGGTTADEQTSVYLIRTGEDDTAVVAGNDGLIEASEPYLVEKVEDPGTTNAVYDAYRVAVLGWLGLQYGSAFSVARVANLHASDSGATCTDAKIYEALSLFPANRQPNLIAMNRQSLKQLRASRTATNATGAPAPRPTEVEGIPIVVTDSIVNTEAVVS